METAAPTGRLGERAHILIVDDEPPLLKVMSLYLRRLVTRLLHWNTPGRRPL